MDIPSKLLTKNHAVTLPVSALYFDTETAEAMTDGATVHTMKLGWTNRVEYDSTGRVRKEKWMEWRTPQVMCRWIASVVYEKTALWVFAHNAFFDLQASGFFKYFTRDGWSLQFVYEQGLTYILVVRKGKKTIKVVSTTNYFECSLKKLGEMVGLKKLEVDFEGSTQQELSEYCHRDVEIIRLAMEMYFSFIRRHDLGSFSMTIPSQAMRAFRHRFMGSKIFIHRVPEVQRLERDSYYGGRTECFRIGELEGGPFATLDVNSMYPAVMATESVPVQLVDFLDHPDSRWLKDALKGHCVVARCLIETDQPIYPVRHNKRVCFPIGRFETVLSTPGIREAQRRGHLVSLGETAVYKKAVVFRSYVRDLYRLRMQYKSKGQDTWVYLCKILLNGLYGKWAQKRPITETTVVNDPEGYRREEILDLVTGRTFVEYQLMNRLITIQGDEEGSNSLTTISAHITEAARLRLWHLIEQAGQHNVLYCDTDSLKLRERDIGRLAHLLHPTKLGALKVEKVTDELTIWGLKCYMEDGVRTIKGIPKKAVPGPNHTYTYQHFLKQATHLRRKQITGMLSETMVKQLHPAYLKGTVQSDGTVKPFVFSLPDLPSMRSVSPSSSSPTSPLH